MKGSVGGQPNCFENAVKWVDTCGKERRAEFHERSGNPMLVGQEGRNVASAGGGVGKDVL